MEIPRYWVEAKSPATDRWRRRVTVARWGWSNESELSAQAHAQSRLNDALTRYGKDPRVRAREWMRGYDGADGIPICEEILDTRGTAILTRNVYGAHCLNTPDTLVVDIDYAESHAQSGWIDLAFRVLAIWFSVQTVFTIFKSQWKLAFLSMAALAGLYFAGMFRRRLRQRHMAHNLIREKQSALARVRSFFEQHPIWGGRVYQTPAGLRVLVTHRLFDPLESDTAKCFDLLGADLVYRRMCVHQRCFRARVSAKPWRAGVRDHMPPSWSGRWPVPPKYAQARAIWVNQYDRVAKDFAACHFMEALGTAHIDPKVQPTLDWHDDLARSNTNLPLA